jgi:diguanylate cyclase (GGDEF)-like protein
MESEIEKSSLEYMENYSSIIQDTHLKDYKKDLDFYIETMAMAISYDLYNLDIGSITKKLKRFVEHEGLCSVVITDSISEQKVASATNKDTTECSSKNIELTYRGGVIGYMNVSYTLKPIYDHIAKSKALIDQNRAKLQKELDKNSTSSIVIQLLISVLITVLLLLLVARQISKNIIEPIYKLLNDMKLLNEEKILQVDSQKYGNDEISRLTKYFYKHTAKLINRLNRRANYDSLTMLLSRQKLMYDITHLENFMIVILDIDRFKEINNFLGISSGDHVLKSTALALSEYFVESPYKIYRLNGDEFALLNEDSNDMDSFERDIREFLRSFEFQELSFGDESISVSMSGGMASSEAKSPMVAATTALKYAKEKKLKIVRFSYELPIIKEYENNLKITKVLKSSIANRLIIPFFQPIQDIREKKITKYEALMRIKDLKDTIYSPGEFLDIAKRSGTYGDISKMMIRQSIAYFTDKDLSVTINLSTEDIENGDIYTLMNELKDNYNNMDRIIFEITEQEGISNFSIVNEFVKKAKELGAKIAIDDFGSGYSNFENIIHLEVDFIKIDGSLIKNILTDKSSEIVVETIIDFAKKLNIKTVAEFISSEAIYHKIESMGVDFAQGYYIGKPEQKLIGEK